MSLIRSEIISKYNVTDEDTRILLQVFDEDQISKVLEVGAHDEPVANILSDFGCTVYGVDLREYNPNQDISDSGEKPICNYNYLRHDFCDLPGEFLFGHWGTFDAAISLSAIEHFGLNTYGEGQQHFFYDVLAMRTIWNLLKVGGVCYLSVPFGKDHLDVVPHWRVYCQASLLARLIQDFTIEKLIPFACDDRKIGNNDYCAGEVVDWKDAIQFPGNPPHLSILCKLRKYPIVRIAPNGR